MLSNIICTVVGDVIGILGAFLVAWISFFREKRSQVSFAATVLYNDLRSIEKYLAHESGSVNLRYSENWQYMVSYCSFLKAEEVEFIYEIYDEVYNYNYQYKLKEQGGKVIKNNIDPYKILKKEMFDKSKGYPNNYSEKYSGLIRNLEKHIKK